MPQDSPTAHPNNPKTKKLNNNNNYNDNTPTISQQNPTGENQIKIQPKPINHTQQNLITYIIHIYISLQLLKKEKVKSKKTYK